MGVDLWLVLLLAGSIFLVISLFLALYWRVFNLIDEISGKKAKRQIAKLREYNKSTGEITSVSTGELELVMAGGGNMAPSPSPTTKTTSELSLREMIDDPYGSVDQGSNKTKYQEPAERSNRSEDGITGILSDVEMGMLNKHGIVILDEQSSLGG